MPDSPTAPATGWARSVVRVVDEALADRGWHEQPTVLIHLTSPLHGEAGLGLAAVDEHPVDALAGCVAPDSWEALGMSQLGWAHDLAGTGQRRRVRVTTLQTRGGEQATVLRDRQTGRAEELGGAGEGRVSDVLRRCLGLPTPSPDDVPLGAFAAAVWLGAAAGAAATATRPLSPTSLAALVPGGPGTMAAGGSAATADGVAESLRAVVRGQSWEELRWATVEGRWVIPGTPATLACWLDTGSFARWVTPETRMIDHLRAALRPDAAALVDATLCSLGLGCGA